MIKLNSREIKKINSIIGTSYDDETLFSEIYSGNRSKIYKKENYCFKFCLISDDYNNEKETYIKLGENEYLAKIYGFDDESRLLVMEYIEGISIEDYFIRERNIPLNIVNRVFEIRLDMLKKYCYDFDIKGRDIFIQNNGNLIFLDFGVVSIVIF